MQWTVLIERDDEANTYGVIVPALPRTYSMGRTVEEALENAREAIALTLESMVAEGEEIDDHEYLPMLAVVDVAIPSAVEADAGDGEITLAGAEKRFGVSTSALRHAIRAGRLESRQIEGTGFHLVRPAAVKAYLASRPGGRKRTYRRTNATVLAEHD